MAETKMSVVALLAHLAKAADLKASELSSGSVNRTQGTKHWKYGYGGYAYGGPVDCSGLIVAIARYLRPNYLRMTSADMEALCEYNISDKLPDKVGALVWRPKTATQSGHVGIYTGKSAAGDMYTVEAFDETDNVARRGNRLAPTAAKPFTKWGYLDFVQY